MIGKGEIFLSKSTTADLVVSLKWWSLRCGITFAKESAHDVPVDAKSISSKTTETRDYMNFTFKLDQLTMIYC